MGEEPLVVRRRASQTRRWEQQAVVRVPPTRLAGQMLRNSSCRPSDPPRPATCLHLDPQLSERFLKAPSNRRMAGLVVNQ